MRTFFNALGLAWGLALTACTAAQGAVVGPAAGVVVDGVAPATVMQVSTHGVGHVNLVPYYTVNSGFDTYINIVNTDTRNGKALKLRFREAGNGEVVYDLTLLLAPGDKWGAALTLDPSSGLPRLVHKDGSCTLPAQVQQLFGLALYPFAPNGDAARSREGHAEVITLADIPRIAPQGSISELYTTIQRTAGDSRCSAAVLAPLALDATSYADARNKGLEAPTTGVFTQWTLINVPRALSFTGRATALEARVGTDGAPGYGNVVLFPQTRARVTDLNRVRASTSNPALRGGVLSTNPPTNQALPSTGLESGLFFLVCESDFPDLSTPYLPAGLAPGQAPGAAPKIQAHAVNKALAVTSIANEYVLEPLIAARTDWVVTMPTRHLSVGPIYPAPAGMGLRIFTNLTVDDNGAPLSAGTFNYFPGALTPGGEFDPICVQAGSPYGLPAPSDPAYRSGRAFGNLDGGFADLQPEDPLLSFQLCGQSSILRLALPLADTSTGVLGHARNRWNLRSTSVAGWGRIATPGVDGQGLPIIGYAARELFNAAVKPGFAGSFGQTYPHSGTAPD